MVQRANNSDSMHQFREGIVDRRAPFWIPASNFYAFALAVAAAVFFLILGILHDGIDDLPWIVAGIGSVSFVGISVFIREVLLRNARERFISANRLDKSVRHMVRRKADKLDPDKLTLERNEAILLEIRKKSEAAKVLGKFSEAHKEVVDLCEKYLNVAANELATAGAGSPRIPAIRKGRGLASGRHRYHMLQWAEIESRSLTQEAKTRDKVGEKLDTAQKALGVVNHALRSYPDDPDLVDSHVALQDFLLSIRVSNSIEKAERAFFKGNHNRAISLYQDALFDLKGRDDWSPGRQMVAEKIDAEIVRIKDLQKLK
ncbi:MAG: hypothetical protein ABIU09_08705 [Pyrinomonadaceae bacterium]